MGLDTLRTWVREVVGRLLTHRYRRSSRRRRNFVHAPALVKGLFDSIHEVAFRTALGLAIPKRDRAGKRRASTSRMASGAVLAVAVIADSDGLQASSGTGRDGKYWHTVTSEVRPGDPAVPGPCTLRDRCASRR
jgi:hypothetical protein